MSRRSKCLRIFAVEMDKETVRRILAAEYPHGVTYAVSVILGHPDRDDHAVRTDFSGGAGIVHAEVRRVKEQHGVEDMEYDPDHIHR